MNALISGESLPKYSFNALPTNLQVKDVTLEDGVATVDLTGNFNSILNESGYATDVVMDILIYNVFKFGDISRVNFTFDGQSDDTFKFSTLSRVEYFSPVDAVKELKDYIPFSLQKNCKKLRIHLKTCLRNNRKHS